MKKSLLKKLINKISGHLRFPNANREGPPASYKSVALSDEGIELESYKKYLGGGADMWDLRGKFQLDLLRELGLTHASRLVDIGCGPIRAGRYFIDFLDEGSYCGFDYNVSFIDAARKIVIEEGLSPKGPVLEMIDDFNIDSLNLKNWGEFGIAFSVLNHCNTKSRKAFFNRVLPMFKQGASLVITHAKWWDESFLTPGWEVQVVMRDQQAFGDRLVFHEYGWSEDANPLPIVHFIRK
ncbi:class I SAM-dependent methyltransferase [Cerasicoccus maritimus]|uniref:class I SAM-dependent methyltransferase n=1 Tax=Cerasicoccus maritimus TaxID=490089 RepID=UPI0028527961|nr:class I SAM-dependent methyltransferase [Cerasicoccus maritimus]